jgi:hypothetical protein
MHSNPVFKKLMISNLPLEMHYKNKLYAYYEEDTDILHIKWNGIVNSREVREGYNQILRMARIFKANKWILNLKERQVLNHEDQRWVFKNVFPEVLRIMKRDVFIAVILPPHLIESMVHKLDGDEMIDNDNLLILNHFLYLEESRRWLMEVNSMSERA